MNWYRIKHTINMYLQQTGQKRARYLKKHNILRHIGDNCMVMPRKIPLYPKLISMGDNVWIATGVTFVTHDAIHHMLNNYIEGEGFQENIGCIDIKDNVFIGANSTVLANVTIGSNTIVGAGTLVNKNIGGGGICGRSGKVYLFFRRICKKTQIFA